MTNSPAAQDTGQRLRQIFSGSFLGLFSIGLTLALTITLSFNLVSRAQVSVIVGEPAGQDIIAPQTIQFISQVETNQAINEAKDSVLLVYTVADLSIARGQINQARAVFNFVDVVRADTMADETSKLRYLGAIRGLTIEPDIAEPLLFLNSSEYEAVRDDVIRIIGEVMRNEIQGEANSLNEARRLARTQISFNLTQAQERAVVGLVQQFIVPNSFFNAEATENNRTVAAAAVAPVEKQVTRGERILRVGEEVTAAHIEILEQLGLLRPVTSWTGIGSAFMLSLLASGLITLYWQRFHLSRYESARHLIILGLLVLVFVLGAKLSVPGRGLYAYLFPASALTMIVAVIYVDSRLAVFVSIMAAALIGYLAQQSLEFALYVTIGPLIAALTLHEQRVNAFFRAGLTAAIGHSVVILIFRINQEPQSAELLQLILFSLLNGVISASLTLAGLFLIGSVSGLTTFLLLQDLSRLDHPLLKELLRRAPGTYHHSLMVANLAEQAAEQIDGDSGLVRVGAFYHDIGKMQRPPFFIENQEGVNPHQTLDPFSSARIILNHVPDGLELARKHHLPNRIQDFIAEHHGNRVVLVFYKKAVELYGEAKVDDGRFRYKGPRPRSRETGIVLLADSVEASSSALRPNTDEGIEKLVNKIVDDHIQDGQLDDSGLTVGDIKLIKESFAETLKGRFHVRVVYPGNEELIVPAGTQPQPLKA